MPSINDVLKHTYDKVQKLGTILENFDESNSLYLITYNDNSPIKLVYGNKALKSFVSSLKENSFKIVQVNNIYTGNTLHFWNNIPSIFNYIYKTDAGLFAYQFRPKIVKVDGTGKLKITGGTKIELKRADISIRAFDEIPHDSVFSRPGYIEYIDWDNVEEGYDYVYFMDKKLCAVKRPKCYFESKLVHIDYVSTKFNRDTDNYDYYELSPEHFRRGAISVLSLEKKMFFQRPELVKNIL